LIIASSVLQGPLKLNPCIWAESKSNLSPNDAVGTRMQRLVVHAQ